MKVTLAYPRDGHQPDTTVDVDEEVGRRLVSDGWARLPHPDPETPPAAPAAAGKRGPRRTTTKEN